VGSLAARGVAEGDRAGVWQAVIVDLLLGVAAWRDPSPGASSFATGLDAVGTRGDIAQPYGAALDPVDSQIAGPFTVDDKPRD
jgi:hypothetical protein